MRNRQKVEDGLSVGKDLGEKSQSRGCRKEAASTTALLRLVDLKVVLGHD